MPSKVMTIQFSDAASAIARLPQALAEQLPAAAARYDLTVTTKQGSDAPMQATFEGSAGGISLIDKVIMAALDSAEGSLDLPDMSLTCDSTEKDVYTVEYGL